MYWVYGTTNCKWCHEAVELLTRENEDFHFINLDKEPQAIPIFQKTFPGAKSVPQIMVTDELGHNNIKWLKGYDELKDWIGGDA